MPRFREPSPASRGSGSLPATASYLEVGSSEVCFGKGQTKDELRSPGLAAPSGPGGRCWGMEEFWSSRVQSQAGSQARHIVWGVVVVRNDQPQVTRLGEQLEEIQAV